MNMNDVVFTHRDVMPIYLRFSALFGPESVKRDDLPGDLKIVVWARMVYAFHPLITPRAVRLHFLKSFHPDTGTDQLSIAEKNKVSGFVDHIFNGGPYGA